MLKLQIELHRQRIRSYFALLILIFGVSSAYAQTANITAGCVPLQVNFTAPGGATGFFWDFKDGASSNLQNPSNTFASAGTYVVEFRESTTGPVVGTVTIIVSAKPKPQITANTPNKGCAPLDVDLSADVSLPAGVTVTNYDWTFGQGSGGNGQNVNFTYSAVGSYTVTIAMTASTPSCNSTVSFVNYIGVSNPIPAIITAPNPPMACTAPLNVTFTDGSTSPLTLTYAWDFGNGATSTAKNPSAQTYGAIGDFIASLTITDTNSCSKTTTIPITVGAPVAKFTSPDTVCLGSATTFTNESSAGIYNWNFGAAASPPTSGAASPSAVFNAAGTYTIDLTVNAASGLCSDQTSRTIVVVDPQVTVNVTPSPHCDTGFVSSYSYTSNVGIVSQTWTFDDGEIDTTANPTHDYHIADSIYAFRGLTHVFTGTVSIVTSVGCVITRTFTDTVYLVYARFMPDIYQGCAPLSVTFSDSSHSVLDIVDYTYDYGDGTSASFSSKNDPNTHVFTTSGIYPVVMTATNINGCKDISDTIWIQVGEPLALDFSADKTTICPKEKVNFTNTSANQNIFDGWNYSSDGELLSGCFMDPNGNFTFDDTVGVFDITLSAYHNGCLSSITKSNFLTVNGPLAKFNYLYDCASPMDIQLTNQSMGFTDLLWDFGDGTTSTSADPLHTYAVKGDYTIVLTATNNSSGCPISRDSVTINIRQINTAFTADPIYCGGAVNDFTGLASTDVFEDCNRGYKWIFSDPDKRPITTENPDEPITFNMSGLQTLTLVTTDINGCTDTLTHTFTVFNLNPDILIDDNTVCTPDTVKFTSQSTADANIVSYKWDFADGSTSTLPTVDHIYTNMAAGGYNIKLVITDEHGCADSTLKAMFFYKPVSTITASPNFGRTCTDKELAFSATDFTAQGSNLTFNWNFGDGTTGTGQNVTHSYGAEIATQVKLYFTEISSGCLDSTTFNVDIQSYPLADFISDADNLVALCSPQQIQFTNTSNSSSPIISTAWTFSNGLTTSSSSPVFVFEKGTYDVQLIVSTSYGCTDTITKDFTVIDPSANFILDTNAVCKGTSITFTITDSTDVGGYTWDFGDGIDSSNVSPITHQYNFLPPSGQTVAKLTVFGAGGVCPKTIEKPVFIHEVRALFDRNDELDTVLCAGELLNIKNNSLNANAYQWDFGDGSNSTNASTTFTHNYNTADTFSITLIVFNTQFGCSDTISKEIIMHDRPVISAIGDTVCIGDLAQLDVAGKMNQYTYVWSPATPLSDANIANPTADLTNSQTFIVVVTDTITTCPSTDTTAVMVIQALENVYLDTTIVVGDYVTLPADNQGGLVLFTWTPDTALTCLDCSNPIHQGFVDITYNLQMVDFMGCSTAEGIYKIHIFPETFLDLPTTFTPNGDGINDIIYLKGWGIKELLYFKIFNRWGELVFETDDISVGWDGYYKGVLQNNDTYTYKAVVSTWKNETLEGAGHINLMR